MSNVPNPWSKDELVISVKAKSIAYTRSGLYMSGNQHPTGGGGGMELHAPRSLMDQVNHTWTPLENVSSRLLGMYAQTVQELKQSTEAHKVDTPSIYEDSDRRVISFTVDLAAYSSPQSDILDIVNFFRQESCPELADDLNTKVGIPSIFEVSTKPVALFKIKNAACTSVQPTFQAPYIGGAPSKCELTLEFTDIEPLSKSRIVESGKVSTS